MSGRTEPQTSLCLLVDGQRCSAFTRAATEGPPTADMQYPFQGGSPPRTQTPAMRNAAKFNGLPDRSRRKPEKSWSGDMCHVGTFGYSVTAQPMSVQHTTQPPCGSLPFSGSAIGAGRELPGAPPGSWLPLRAPSGRRVLSLAFSGVSCGRLTRRGSIGGTFD